MAKTENDKVIVTYILVVFIRAWAWETVVFLNRSCSISKPKLGKVTVNIPETFLIPCWLKFYVLVVFGSDVYYFLLLSFLKIRFRWICTWPGRPVREIGHFLGFSAATKLCRT